MDLKMLTNVTQIIYIQSLYDVTIVQRWNGAENVFEISEQFIEYYQQGDWEAQRVSWRWATDSDSVLYKA